MAATWGDASATWGDAVTKWDGEAGRLRKYSTVEADRVEAEDEDDLLVVLMAAGVLA